MRGCVSRIRIWPLRRDDQSDVLIDAAGTRSSDWLLLLLLRRSAKSSIAQEERLATSP